MNTDKVYKVYEEWYKQKYPNGGVHFEDAFLEFAEELFEKLESAQHSVQRDHTPNRTYYIQERDGRYYVYVLRFAPVETLFEVASTRGQAEQAIRDHKEGKHSTQDGSR